MRSERIQTSMKAVPVSTAQPLPRLQSAARGVSLPQEEPALSPLLLRVVRTLVFEVKRVPELDALPLAQLRLLWAVHALTEGTMTDFSERLGVSQSTVTQLADRLERRSLIERHTDPGDRRVVRLRTSAPGRELLERAETQRNELHSAVWEALSPTEQQSVLLGLEILATAAETQRGRPGRPLECESGAGSTMACAGPEAGPAQPMVDLMARRVRGTSGGHLPSE